MEIMGYHADAATGSGRERATALVRFRQFLSSFVYSFPPPGERYGLEVLGMTWRDNELLLESVVKRDIIVNMDYCVHHQSLYAVVQPCCHLFDTPVLP